MIPNYYYTPEKKDCLLIAFTFVNVITNGISITSKFPTICVSRFLKKNAFRLNRCNGNTDTEEIFESIGAECGFVDNYLVLVSLSTLVVMGLLHTHVKF